MPNKMENRNLELNYEEQQHVMLMTVASMMAYRRIGRLISDPLEADTIHAECDARARTILDELLQSFADDTAVSQVHGFALKFIHRKVSSIRKVPDIDAFIDDHKDKHKLLVVQDYSGKIDKQFNDVPNLELFKMSELLVDIAKHIYVPLHVLLTEEQAKNMMIEFDVGARNMSRIFDKDPMARYLCAVPGDVVMIMRMSPTVSVTYRYVVRGNVE